MSPELQEQLYEKYPRILASLGNPSSPASCSTDCGDGWYRLVERLLDCVQDLADEQGAMQHVAVQVKEKFGSLRVHWVASDERVDAMTVFAQALSCFICEQCGNPATRDTNGWIRTRCDKHWSPH